MSNPHRRAARLPTPAIVTPDVRNCPETLNRDGAQALAQRLQRYWRDRGYRAVCFWAEPIDERFDKVGTYEIYRVACNLVNGLPPPCRDVAQTPAIRPPRARSV